jgi:hypothetical protein
VFHNASPAREFTAVRAYLDEHTGKEETEILRSYAAGLLCHYALDSAAHPFVYASVDYFLAKKILKAHSAVAHNAIEYGLDVEILFQKFRVRPHMFPPRYLFSEEPRLLEIQAGLMKHTLAQIAGVMVKRKKIIEAYRDTARVCRFFHDPHYRKRRVFHALERPVGANLAVSSLIYPKELPDGLDFANRQGREWVEGRQESFFEIYENAVQSAADLMAAFFAGRELSGLTLPNYKGITV